MRRANWAKTTPSWHKWVVWTGDRSPGVSIVARLPALLRYLLRIQVKVPGSVVSHPPVTAHCIGFKTIWNRGVCHTTEFQFFVIVIAYCKWMQFRTQMSLLQVECCHFLKNTWKTGHIASKTTSKKSLFPTVEQSLSETLISWNLCKQSINDTSS